MESAGLVRGGEHPNLISSHHWSQKEVLKRSPENFQQTRRKTIAEDVLPLDPRNWNRADVARWLTMMSYKHHIQELKPERFLMNGKGLCLMTVDMYLNRVPLGGKLLYRDFQIRLAKAMYL